MDRETKVPDPQGRASDDRGASRKAGMYAGLGLQFAVLILVFLYAGRWLDRRLETAPWFLIFGVFFGASLGFYSMYRRLMADLKQDEEAKRR